MTSPDRPKPADRRWVPLYETLRLEITSGNREVDSLIPPLSQLSTQYGVSVRSARTAVERLEAEGLVRMESGIGTFVAGTEPAAPIDDRVAVLERDLARARQDLDRLMAAIFPPDMAAGPDL